MQINELAVNHGADNQVPVAGPPGEHPPTSEPTNDAGTYVGQVERDPDGVLWAVLYRGQAGPESRISRERVRSLRQGKRRVANLVLAAADIADSRRRTR